MAIDNSTRVQLKFLSLISKVYSFEHLRPSHPTLADIGRKSVVSVIFHENQVPEIGLSDSPGQSDAIEYYPFDEILIFPVH